MKHTTAESDITASVSGSWNIGRRIATVAISHTSKSNQRDQPKSKSFTSNPLPFMRDSEVVHPEDLASAIAPFKLVRLVVRRDESELGSLTLALVRYAELTKLFDARICATRARIAGSIAVVIPSSRCM